MRHSITILLLAALLLTACNPLRKVQRNQKADSTVVDRSEIHKVVTDILRESGTLTQTIVEFYPPVGRPDSEQPAPTGNAAALPVTERPRTSPPAIKRIVHTEVAAESERIVTTDSVARNDIHTTTHSELSEKVVEKPPAGTQTVKWIAVGLVALLLIIVILKFSKIKLWPSRD
nr:MAG TPA: hypothetical protein [Caudoviricetes sp.]